MQKLATVCCVLLSVLRWFWVFGCFQGCSQTRVTQKVPLTSAVVKTDELKFQRYTWLLLLCEKAATRERFRGFFVVDCDSPACFWCDWRLSATVAPEANSRLDSFNQVPVTKILLASGLGWGKWAQRCRFIFCWMQKCTEISPGCHFFF